LNITAARWNESSKGDNDNMGTLTLQKIFHESFPEYAQERRLPLKQLRAVDAIMRCRTPEQGGHVQACPDGHEERIQYHSCRHRSCPQCSALPKAQWTQKQMQRLLATDHFHAIFTVPHELLPLWRYNTAWFVQTLFDTVRRTVITLARDPRHLGALPGVLLSLHTWGRNLSLHPHIHALITGGGLTAEGTWRATRHGYLFPARVVCALYRGKLLGALWDALRSGQLTLPPETPLTAWIRTFKALGRKKWNVCLQPPYAHGAGVMKYLARYVKGGPLANHRLRDAGADHIAFHYTDHRDGRDKTLRLRRAHFINRLLDHVFEPGQHAIRHAGLYAHHAHDQRARCREQLGQPPETPAADLPWQEFLRAHGHADRAHCTTCRRPLVRARSLAKKSSILSGAGGGYVQHNVQAPIGFDHRHESAPHHGPPAIFFRPTRALN
jgi:hypothetical protein